MHMFQHLTSGEECSVCAYDECKDPNAAYAQKDIDYLIRIIERLDSRLSASLVVKSA